MSIASSIRNLWQGRLDRAVALSESGVAGAGLTTPPGSAGAAVAGVGAGTPQGALAPQLPIRPADVQIVESKDQKGNVLIYGVPGTLITSGFLLPWETNPWLAGRLGIDTYHRMRNADTQVDKTLEMCFQPILSAKWELQPDPDAEGKENLKKEIAEKAKQNLFSGLGWWAETGLWVTQSWHEVLRNCLLALCFGVSAHERVFRIDGDQLLFARFADLPPRTFYRFDMQPDGRTLRALIQLGFRREYYSQLEVPAERLTMFVHRQEGADLWGRSMLRPAYPHWQIKNQLYKVRALAAERNQLGIPCITLPPNPSKDDVAAAYEFVTQLAAHKRTGLRLPNGAIFKIHGVEGTLYDSMPDIVHHNEQISFVALDFFSNLGRGAGGASGNRALGASQGKFFILALQNVASYIAQRFSQTDLRYWTYFNYGVGAPVPMLTFANVQSRSFEEVMVILANAAGNGLVKSDLGIRGEIRKQCGLPDETDEDVIATKGETLTVGKESGQMSGKGAEPVAGAGKQQAGGEGEQSGGGKQKTKEGAQLSAVGYRLSVPTSKRKRDQLSPFWHEAADPRYKLVHANETHVDFPEHDRALGSAESAIASLLRGAKPASARAVAEKLARAIKGGRLPSSVTFEHDEDLRSQISKTIGKAYAFGKEAALGEHERLMGKRNQKSEVRSQNPEQPIALVDSPVASPKPSIPDLYAEIAVEDFGNQLAHQARNVANDLRKAGGVADKSAGELSDEILDAMLDYSEAYMERIAAEAARSGLGAGRADALEVCKRELEEADGFYERTGVLDKNTCGPCDAADGDQIPASEGPPPDPWEICEGGEACRCQWYEVMLAGAEPVNPQGPGAGG
jgi:hypothetical protein